MPLREEYETSMTQGTNAGGNASEEIELKLATDAQALQRLPRTALLRSLRSDRVSQKKLASTYYDTPELALRARGIALRVRNDGARYVQTLKAPLLDHNGKVRANGGLQHLREFEAELEAPDPDLGLIADPALQAFFSEAGIAQDLEPVFSTDIDRQIVPLEFADSRVELALDSGRISANGTDLPVCEAELELKSGRSGHLYELAMMLHRKVPFRLEQDSKAARGYKLYSETVPKPHKAEKPTLSPDMTVAQAFETQARACLWQMRANEAAVLDGRDPEGVHQMRVAIRRLRALVSAFKDVFNAEASDFLRGELRWMQQQLGPARDWDVFLEETYAPLRKRLPSAESLGRLESQAEAIRAEAYDQARKAVHDDRYTELLLRLQLWLHTGGWRLAVPPGESDPAQAPVAGFARATLDKRAKKFVKLGNKYKSLTEPDLHEIRIRGKKLRYASEFFAGVFKKKNTRAYLKALEAIQDRLGAINDAATGQLLLDQVERRMTKGGKDAAAKVDAANATGLVQGWQVALIDRELRDFEAVWKDFRKVKPFWK
jgi:inorganic triphosphatase YgiF